MRQVHCKLFERCRVAAPFTCASDVVRGMDYIEGLKKEASADLFAEKSMDVKFQCAGKWLHNTEAELTVQLDYLNRISVFEN